MSVDVFGRQLHSVRGPMRGPPCEGFCLTPEGDYDITNKRLCHVALPMDVHDAINLDYAEDLIKTVYPNAKEVG